MNKKLWKKVGVLTGDYTGKWIKSQGQNVWGMDVECYECSECGIKAIDHIFIMNTEGLNYCPNCGAKMERRNDE